MAASSLEINQQNTLTRSFQIDDWPGNVMDNDDTCELIWTHFKSKICSKLLPHLWVDPKDAW